MSDNGPTRTSVSDTHVKKGNPSRLLIAFHFGVLHGLLSIHILIKSSALSRKLLPRLKPCSAIFSPTPRAFIRCCSSDVVIVSIWGTLYLNTAFGVVILPFSPKPSISRRILYPAP